MTMQRHDVIQCRIRELTTKYFSIGDNSNLSHAATKTTHTKSFNPYLFIEPP